MPNVRTLTMLPECTPCVPEPQAPTRPCKVGGPKFLPDDLSCGKFWHCVCTSGVAYLIDCPEGFHWNMEKSRCDAPNIACCDPNVCKYRRYTNYKGTFHHGLILNSSSLFRGYQRYRALRSRLKIFQFCSYTDSTHLFKTGVYT